MVDLQWDVPETEEVEVDEETLAGIDRGIEDCRNGRWYTLEEVRMMIPQWIAKYESQKPR